MRLSLSVLVATCICLSLSTTVLGQSPASTCLSGATPFQLASACAPGWYCPLFNASDPNTAPVQCAPTDDCMLDRLVSKWCGAQGTYEPVLCAEGSYCPTPTQQIECPEGYVCPRGQFAPYKCGALTSCPAGGKKKFDYSSMIAVLITDVCLVALWFAAMAWRKAQWAARDATYKNVQISSVNASLYNKGSAYHQLPAHSKLLCQGFKRAQNDLPVMRLDFTDLSMTIPQSKTMKAPLTILKGVTGSIEPGKVTAVMGPSGAGKTTFLSTMLGKVDSSWTRGGSLRVNGADEPLTKFRRIIGYVPQEDIMHRDLSVYDNIRYAANVRLPRKWTAKQKEDHVNATISAMQLKHVQDTRVGDEEKRGISGGQRKRCSPALTHTGAARSEAHVKAQYAHSSFSLWFLSPSDIGMEVAAAPSLLLLDEPTSGLDSTAALEICQVLKDLARVSSLTVAMVIHQPRVEIWNQLDELLLLAPGGLTVYQGPQRFAMDYFAQRFDVHCKPAENPADALMDRIAEQGEEFVARWKDGGKEFVEALRAAAPNAGSPSPPISIPEEDDEQADVDAEGAEGLSVVPSPSPAGVIPGQLPSADSRSYSGKDVVVHVVPRRSSDDGFAAPHKSAKASYGAVLLPTAFDSDHSLRSTSSFVAQVWMALVRSLWKQCANVQTLYLEAGLGLVAGGIMGALVKLSYQGVLLPPYTLLSPSPLEGLIGMLVFNVGLAISLAAVSAGVSVFGEEQIIYRREVAAGHSHLAYYLGVNLAQFPRLFLDALHFAWIFHIQNQPLTQFHQFFAIVFLIYTAIYGMAFFVSMVVSRKNAPLLGVVISLTFSSMTAKGGQPEFIQKLSASRWAAEALFSIETAPFAHIMTVHKTAERNGYTLDQFSTDLALMFIVGLLYRFIAYIAMRIADRKIIVK